MGEKNTNSTNINTYFYTQKAENMWTREADRVHTLLQANSTFQLLLLTLLLLLLLLRHTRLCWNNENVTRKIRCWSSQYNIQKKQKRLQLKHTEKTETSPSTKSAIISDYFFLRSQRIEWQPLTSYKLRNLITIQFFRNLGDINNSSMGQ